MTTGDLGLGITAMLKGKQFAKDAHRYMERAVDGLEALIKSNKVGGEEESPSSARVSHPKSILPYLFPSA